MRSVARFPLVVALAAIALGGLACSDSPSPMPADAGSDGCAAQLASDPENCGACGRSCLGGTCSAGVCAPVRLGDSLDFPSAALWHQGVLYVGVSKQLWRVALDSGAPVVAKFPLDASPSELLADDRLYLLLDGTAGPLASMPLTGGTPTPFVPSGQSYRGVAMAMSSTTFYLAGSQTDLWIVPRADPSKLTKVDLFTVPYVLRTTATHLFWFSFFNSTIVRAPLGDPAAEEPVLQGIGGTFAKLLELDATHIYVNAGDGLVGHDRVVRGEPGGTLETMAQAASYLTALAVDATHVYWAESESAPGQSDGRILRLAKSDPGGTPDQIAAGVGAVAALAVDEDALAWTDVGWYEAAAAWGKAGAGSVWLWRK